jgi:hypothetical protein
MQFGVMSMPDPAGCYHHNVSGYNSHVVEVYGVIGGYEGNKIIEISVFLF